MVIDDFKPNLATYLGEELKNWADKYKVTVEVKSETIEINFPILIVTSNLSIGEVFKNLPAYKDPLLRRFK